MVTSTKRICGLHYSYGCATLSAAYGLDHSVTELSKPDSLDGFWELSEQIFNRISDKSDHVNYLFGNRDVAMFL